MLVRNLRRWASFALTSCLCVAMGAIGDDVNGSDEAPRSGALSRCCSRRVSGYARRRAERKIVERILCEARTVPRIVPVILDFPTRFR